MRDVEVDRDDRRDEEDARAGAVLPSRSSLASPSTSQPLPASLKTVTPSFAPLITDVIGTRSSAEVTNSLVPSNAPVRKPRSVELPPMQQRS